MGHLKALIKEINLRRVCLCCSLFSSATNYQFLPDSLRTLIYQLSLGNVFVLDLSKQGIKVLPSCFALMWCCQVVTLNKVSQVLSKIVKIIKNLQRFATHSLQVTFISVDLEGVNLSVRDCSTYIWSSGIFPGAKMLKKFKIHLFYLVSYNLTTN